MQWCTSKVYPTFWLVVQVQPSRCFPRASQAPFIFLISHSRSSSLGWITTADLSVFPSSNTSLCHVKYSVHRAQPPVAAIDIFKDSGVLAVTIPSNIQWNVSAIAGPVETRLLRVQRGGTTLFRQDIAKSRSSSNAK